MIRNILCYLFYIRANHGFFLREIAKNLIQFILYSDDSLANVWFTTEEKLARHCYTPLSWSCKQNDPEMISYLLRIGAKPHSDCKNHNGENKLTALEVALESSNLEVLALFLTQSGLGDLDCVDLFLEHSSKMPQKEGPCRFFLLLDTCGAENITKHKKIVTFLSLIFSRATDADELNDFSGRFYTIFDQMDGDSAAELLKTSSMFLSLDAFAYLYERFKDSSLTDELFASIAKDPILVRRTQKIRYLLNEKNCKLTVDMLTAMIDGIDSAELLKLLKSLDRFAISAVKLNEEFVAKLLMKHDGEVLKFFLEQQQNILQGDSYKKTLFEVFTTKGVANYVDKIKILHQCELYDNEDLCSDRQYSFLPWIASKAKNPTIFAEYMDLFDYITSRELEYLFACRKLLESLSKNGHLVLYKHFLSAYGTNFAEPESFFKLYSVFFQDGNIVDCRDKIDLLLDKYCGCFSTEVNQRKFCTLLLDLLEKPNNSAHTACLTSLLQREPYKSILRSDHNLLYSMLLKMDRYAISFFSEFFINSQFFYSHLIPKLAKQCNTEQLFFLMKTVNAIERKDRKDLFIEIFWKNFDIKIFVNKLDEKEPAKIQETLDFLQAIFNMSNSSHLKFLFSLSIDCDRNPLFGVRVAAMFDEALCQLKQRGDICLDEPKPLCHSIFQFHNSLSQRRRGRSPKELASDFFYGGLQVSRHTALLDSLLSLDDTAFQDVIIAMGRLFDENFTKLTPKEAAAFLDFLENVWSSEAGRGKIYDIIKRESPEELYSAVSPAFILGLMQCRKKFSAKNCRDLDLSMQKISSVFAGCPKMMWKMVYFCLALGKRSMITQELWDEVFKKENFKHICPIDLDKTKESVPASYFMHALKQCHDNATLLDFIIQCEQKCKSNSNQSLYQFIADFLVQDCLTKQNFVLLACLALCSAECSNIMQDLLKNPQKINIESDKVNMWVFSYAIYLLAGICQAKSLKQSNYGHDNNYDMGLVNISQDQDVKAMSELIEILRKKIPAVEFLKENNFLYDLGLGGGNIATDGSLTYCDNISIIAAELAASLRNGRSIKMSSSGSVLSVEFFLNGGSRFSLPLHCLDLLISRLNVGCVGKLLSDNELFAAFIAHGDENLYRELNSKIGQLDTKQRPSVNKDVLFRVWQLGGFRALDRFTTFALGLHSSQGPAVIVPDFKNNNCKGGDILCFYYKRYQEVVNDKNCSAEDKNNYFRLLRNLCFFYTADDILGLDLPLCNRAFILQQFFSFSSAAFAGINRIGARLGLTAPSACEIKLSPRDSTEAGTSPDPRSVRRGGTQDELCAKDDAAQTPSTEIIDAEAMKFANKKPALDSDNFRQLQHRFGD